MRPLDWIGIGAQRCGTTWFTEMLVSHPSVGLFGDRKELHAWDSALIGRSSAPTPVTAVEPFLGEFTPAYLRMPWCIEAVLAAVSSEAPIYVLLRDPVERFRSAMDLYLDRGILPDDPSKLAEWVRLRGADAVWGGMYWQHLRGWLAAGATPLVLVYEQLRSDPRSGMSAAWEALEVDPIDLAPRPPSRTVVPRRFAWPDGLQGRLTELYRPEVTALVDEGFLPSGLWPTESG